MAKVDRKIIVAVSVILFLLVAVFLYRSCRPPLPLQPPKKTDNQEYREDFEMIQDDGVGAAPSSEQLLSNHGMQGPRCGIREATHLGYKYAVPEEPPCTEDLMPEDDACGSTYDVEAAQAVPYVFTYPLTAAITKTRLEQAGDMWRGDLDGVEPRSQACDFKTIWNYGDHLAHGAFSDFTKKSHELAGCNKQFGNNGVWVRDAPACVANESLVMDGQCGC